jgi:hypothetical protein
MLFFTKRRKIKVLRLILNYADLSWPSCVLIDDFALFSGASLRQADKFIEEYRRISKARKGFVGFEDFPDISEEEELIKLRAIKLQRFKEYLENQL